MLYLDYQKFLTSLLKNVSALNITISNLELDHIAYQTSSSIDYDKTKPKLLQIADEVHEAIVGGRRVGIFKLHSPIHFDGYVIPAIEIIEPKQGEKHTTGLQHAEFVIDESFESFIAKYPTIDWDTSSIHRDEYAHLKLHFKDGLTVKFHHQSILNTTS
ncbi:VOC family protein [Candidatus Dojkabacteria bacterium]|uniref:VOC family protein n=1 Tax=Candidatus Dojkabacteria bacterium TaxID=2099670 RepID=A0A955L8L1_9BACT|nr:VOC family protein [Candidatus Dojkabacteria bacterium]